MTPASIGQQESSACCLRPSWSPLTRPSYDLWTRWWPLEGQRIIEKDPERGSRPNGMLLLVRRPFSRVSRYGYFKVRFLGSKFSSLSSIIIIISCKAFHNRPYCCLFFQIAGRCDFMELQIRCSALFVHYVGLLAALLALICQLFLCFT